MLLSSLFFFTATATTEIYTLSLHDALPIFGRPGDRRDALRPRKARDARRVPAAQPVSRQEDDQRPDVRAVLGDGRGPRLFHRLSRRIDHGDADRRRRPFRGGPSGAPHDLAHDGDDAGRAERDLGWRGRPSSAIARRVSRVWWRLDRAVARSHGPALR